MSEFTEEEMEERITKEQRSIAGDQFFREALMAVAQKAQSGIYDPYVYEVGAELYEAFKKDNPLQARKKKTKGGKDKE